MGNISAIRIYLMRFDNSGNLWCEEDILFVFRVTDIDKHATLFVRDVVRIVHMKTFEQNTELLAKNLQHHLACSSALLDYEPPLHKEFAITSTLDACPGLDIAM